MIPAMVLCAGFGTRLRPITDTLPKPLVPVGDRAAVLHVIEWVAAAGCEPIAMNTHHRAEAFSGRIPDTVRVVHEEGRILGTAGGVAHAAPALGPGEVLVWNGDVLAEPDLSALVQSYRCAEGSLATLLVVPRPVGEGTVGVGADRAIVRLRGETFGDEVSGADFLGIQVLSARARGILPDEGCLVGDVYLPALRSGDRVNVAWHDGDWMDIGNPRALLEANLRWLRGRGLAAWVESSARVGEGASLDASVVCEGAQIAGGVSLRRCVVLPGAAVEVSLTSAIVLPGRGAIAV